MSKTDNHDDSLDFLLSTPSPASNLPSTLHEHLSYPSTSSEPSNIPNATSEQPKVLLKDRLYIGNLHPSVDEYSLLQIFSKFGKVTKLDFLFHRAGLLKGKPRGYAFIEYGSKDDAQRALTMAHDKLLRGRKILVTYAHQAPLDHGGSSSIYGSTGTKHRKWVMETGRPTTLSLIKSGQGSRHDGTRDKIAMMEAKLKQMESTNSAIPGSLNTSSISSTASLHPSLPPKPPPSLPPSIHPNASQSSSRVVETRRSQPKSPLPSLPILQTKQPLATGVSSTQQRMVTGSKSKLLGIRIKAKEKDKQANPDSTL